MRLRKIELTEKDELEPILISNPEIIEEGLFIVGHQITTPTGPLDILAADEEGTLVLIELKNDFIDDEKPLLQALRYYDWCIENRAWIAHSFKDKKLNPQKEPRLMIIAPEYSESLKRLAKYLSIEVELFRYQAVELPSKEKTVICDQVFYEERPEIPKISTLQQSHDRIKDDAVKNLFTKVMGSLKELNFDLQPRSQDTVSGFFQGKRVLRLYPKHHFFGARALMSDNSLSPRMRIQTDNDWDEFFREYLQPCLNTFENK